MNKAIVAAAPVTDAGLARIVDEFSHRIEGGEAVDLDAFVQEHSQHADELRRLLPAMVALLDLGYSSAHDRQSEALTNGSAEAGRLGDFRILHEIGRGGMGVVYEAEQISLSRRVALKVLPFAAVLDERQLARFKNEATAAALLRHPHIVGVHTVGCERGVHFYAMELIVGQSLAELIEGLREKETPRAAEATTDYRAGVNANATPSSSPLPARETDAKAQRDTRAVAPFSTLESTTSPTFYGAVARLGIQAAEALEYAHQNGIVHRDIKPSNLLLDTSGHLWVTDLGLARIGGDTKLTMTGDLLGTLRYMSPEQALGMPAGVDHRSDVYSLGITLYELLTLTPAFADDDRQRLLRRIADESPRLPRSVRLSIPADLETIVLKAIAKDRADRYATAQHLADDLRRYLGDQPIRARRPGLLMRTRMWSRRHRTIVTTAGAVAACALVLGTGLLWRERSHTLSALARADADFRNAQDAVDKYLTAVSQSTLLDAQGMEPLRRELLESAVQYYQTFVIEHADDPALKAELAAAHIRLAHIYNQIGSNQWIDEMQNVIEIIEPLVEQGADVSHWTSLRDGVFFKEYRTGSIDEKDAAKAALVYARGIAIWEKLSAAHPDVPGFASDLAGLHMVRATALSTSNTGSKSLATDSYQQAIANWERFPGHTMGTPRQLMLGMAYRALAQICDSKNDREAEYAYATKAIDVLASADRPAQLRTSFDSELFGAYMLRTWGALGIGRENEAMEACRKLVALEPLTSEDYIRRGRAFDQLKDPDKALAEFTRAIEMSPNHPPYSWRVRFYLDQARYQEALDDCNKAMQLEPDDTGWLNLRATAFTKLRQSDKALADFNRAIELQPGDPNHYRHRADLYESLGKYHSVITDYSIMIKLDPTSAVCFNNRGVARCRLGDYGAALTDYAKAIEINPTAAVHHCNRADCFLQLQRHQEALNEIDVAIQLEPRQPYVHMIRSQILTDMRQFDQALVAIGRGIEQVPDSPILRQARVDLLMRLQRYDDAVTAVTTELELAKRPEHKFDTLLWRGRVQRLQGRLDKAEADFLLAVEECDRALREKLIAEGDDFQTRRSKANAELRHYEAALADIGSGRSDAGSVLRIRTQIRAEIFFDRQQFEQAAKDLEQAVNDAPEIGLLRSTFGAALAELRRYDKATAELTHAIEIEPASVDHLYRRGWVASMQGRYEDARVDLEKAVQREPSDPLSIRRLAWFLATCPEEKYRDSARAVALAEKAVSINWHNGVFWYTLGICQYRAGNYDRAKQACRQALELRERPYSLLREPHLVTDYDRYAGFFLAMSHWQAGDKDKAVAAYNEAQTWMKSHAAHDEQITRFRNEARLLLGIVDET